MTGLFVILLSLAVAGVVEKFVHQRRLRRIRLRIHVNGTRGKSTTTRLIAAGLRAGGIRTVAKTTGTAPRLILEDGTERPLRRLGPPNIIEQVRMAAVAYKREADALVVECMALRPEYQWVSARMVDATIGVITNVRDDHLDVMGATMAEAARTLSLTIPHAGHLVTAEERYLEIFAQRAREQRTVLHAVDGSSVPNAIISRFSYLSFGENIACALKVCELAGVDRDTALRGMVGAPPDPGVTGLLELTRAGRRFVLVNAFAANDPTSTALIWRMFKTVGSVSKLPVLAIMNNRADRVARLADLAAFLVAEVTPAHVILIGEAGPLARRLIARCGGDVSTVRDLTRCRRPEAILDAAAGLIGNSAVLFALGNSKGIGRDLSEYFARNGKVYRHGEEVG